MNLVPWGLEPRLNRFACVVSLLAALCGCSESPVQIERPEKTSGAEAGLAGHRQMIEALAVIRDKIDLEHPQLGSKSLRFLRQQLDEHTGNLDPARLCQLHTTLGTEELKGENTREAIKHLTIARGLLSEMNFSSELDRVMSSNGVTLQLGAAYMRLGETENCCKSYNAESCILPIRGEGIHTKEEGSREAIKCFTEVLEAPRPSRQPMDHLKTHLAAKWLLNLAYMTIGGYPDDVPLQHRIPTSVFESKVEFPHFTNIGPKLGLETFNLCGAVIVDDFDGDHDLDILTSSWDPASPTKYFRNESNGDFSDQTENSGLAGMYGGLHMNQADYDNDGDLDVFVFRGAWGRAYGKHPNSLLRNNGDGTFVDVTFAAGLGNRHHPTQTGAWADYDNDGDLDLFIGNESTGDVLSPCELYRNNGDGTFTDVAEAAGVSECLFAKGVSWGDFNGDRYPDLFVSNCGGPNRLYRNDQDGTFTDVAQASGVAKPINSFPTWFWDYDNDGALDLWVGVSSGPIGLLALYAEGVGVTASDETTRQIQRAIGIQLMSLYRGNGKGGFVDKTRDANLMYPAQPMGCNFGDLNNDGFLDFYLGTGDVALTELRPNLMFLNDGGQRFDNVTMAGGFGHLQKGHGVSFADLDSDGDNDVYIQLGGAYRSDRYNDALFENPGFNGKALSIQLQGTRSNRSGIGARIHARITEGGKQRSIYRHVDSGSSFGCNPLRQSIGVGKARQIDLLEIFWPTTGETQRFENVEVGRTVLIVEDEPDVQTLILKPFKFGTK